MADNGLGNEKLPKGTWRNRKDPAWSGAGKREGASGIDADTLTSRNNSRPWILSTTQHTHTQGRKEIEKK